MRESVNFLLAGVGGQGTILASDVLVHAGVAFGYQAKQAEIHGMSQRGGSVTTHVRWGRTVHSPLTGAGEVDVFLAFEKLEALRHLHLLRPGGIVVVNLAAIEPITVSAGGQAYPSDAHLRATVDKAAGRAVYVNGADLATGLGNARVANVVLLGALSAVLEQALPDFGETSAKVWLDVIAERVPPQHVELNRLAFVTGREFMGKTG